MLWEHFFIDEPTVFSTYCINHLDEVFPEYYDKRFNKSSNSGHCQKVSSFAESSQAVRTLFKQDHFIGSNMVNSGSQDCVLWWNQKWFGLQSRIWGISGSTNRAKR